MVKKTQKKKPNFLPIVGLFLIIFIVGYIGYNAKVKDELERNESYSTINLAFASAPSDFKPAPNFELPDVNGRKVRLSDFKGKVIILDFWATWCPPCRAEIPGFIELYKKYKDKGVEIIGISLDEGGVRDVLPFMKEFGINYTILIGNYKVTQDYGGIRGIPTTFVIDKKGNIRAKYVGYRPKEVFERDIIMLLNEK
jgi:thiol-disulfide isomerase/thioredoxin